MLESSNFAYSTLYQILARMTNHPLKGRDQGHIAHFLFRYCNHISGTAEARVAKFCLHVEYSISKLLLAMG